MGIDPSKPSRWDALRKRAEEMLGAKPDLDGKRVEHDILRLIHELEVRHVELEIQGEELRAKNLELQEVLHRYSELYHKAPAGFVTLDVKGEIIEANNAAVEMLGLSRKSLVQMGFARLLHTEDRKKYVEILAELNGIPGGRARGELRLMRGRSTPFYAHVEVAPHKSAMGKMQGWLVAFIDISRSKNAENKLQEVCSRLEESQSRLKRLSARLLSAQEEERKRIAGELHDSIGQTLAAMKFSIEHSLGNNPVCKPEEATAMLDRLIPILQNAIEEVRNIYSGLRPVMLDDFGIIATLGWFCRQFAASFPGIHVELTIDIEEKDVPDGLKIVIFRIVQEALNNAAKHSHAEWVDLTLRGERGWVDLIVEDDGIGFSRQAPSQKSDDRAGIGLASMRERAELSGGVLSITSGVGTGARIEVKWDMGEYN
jgi:PAS domain S-box-containing protein